MPHSLPRLHGPPFPKLVTSQALLILPVPRGPPPGDPPSSSLPPWILHGQALIPLPPHALPPSQSCRPGPCGCRSSGSQRGPGDSIWATSAGLCLPTVDYYFGPPRPRKPHTELETDEEKEELSEWNQAVPTPSLTPSAGLTPPAPTPHTALTSDPPAPLSLTPTPPLQACPRCRPDPQSPVPPAPTSLTPEPPADLTPDLLAPVQACPLSPLPPEAQG